MSLGLEDKVLTLFLAQHLTATPHTQHKACTTHVNVYWDMGICEKLYALLQTESEEF